MSAFVSVVVPVRNGTDHLGDQLDALAGQRIDPTVVAGWEVLVADNGSTDGTAELVLARRSGFPTALRLVDASARPGAAAARNLGALAALAGHADAAEGGGEAEAVEHVLAFCDADDRVGPEWVSAAAAALGEEASAAGARDVVVGPLRRLTEPFDPQAPALGRGAMLRARYGVSVLSCTLALRADLFERVGGFDAGLAGYGGEDTEFSIRLNAAGARFDEAPGMVLWFREPTGTATRARKRWARDAAQVRLWTRHPETYPIQSRASYVPLELLTLPVALAAAARAGGPSMVADTLISRGAHAGEWVRRGWRRARGTEQGPVLLADLEVPPER